MESQQEAKLNMYHAVIALCDANPAAVALILAFSNAFNNFKTTVSAIVAAAAALELPATGYAADKSVARKNLAQLGSDIAAQVYAYAVVSADLTLRDAMKISYSRIFKAKDDDVVSICTGIYDKANPIVGSLADYGVTPAILATFQNSITAYSGKSPLVRLSIGQRKQVRIQIKTMFGDADTILKDQMDKVSQGYNLLDPFFKGSYDAVRTIVDPGSYHTLLRLKVIHSITGEAVRNVRCTMDKQAVAKKSSAQGTVIYKNPEQGVRHLVFRHKAFKDTVIEALPVSYGDVIMRIVVLEPLAYQPVVPDPDVKLQQVVPIPAHSTVNVPYSFTMHDDYVVIVTNPNTSKKVSSGFGPDANTIDDPQEIDNGVTFSDSALNLGFSAVNTKLNFKNDTDEDALVVLMIKKP